MQITRIQNNPPAQQPAFSGGISHNLCKKLLADGAEFSDVFEKSAKISDINENTFVLSDGLYNVKEKTAEFILSAVDRIKFIPGLENVNPKVLKVKGSSLNDAFKNIKPEELASANKVLAEDYNTKYIQTKEFREAVYAKRDADRAELDRKFQLADGFWVDYYKSLNSVKK